MTDQLSYDELGFAVQPITSLMGPDIRNWYEWLIRPHDVEAEAYIDAVESLGECLSLDRLVVRKALDWLSLQPLDTRLSINVFASSICHGEFLDYLVEEIAIQDVSPEQICIEITEHQAITNLANATRFARMIRRFGVQIALDDIGSGNMHMGLLVPLKMVDYLKIDRCWVTPAIESERHRETLEGLVAFGRRIGIELVLEGVETKEHYSLVSQLDVDYYQGFYDGLPTPISIVRHNHNAPQEVSDWLQIA